MLVDLGRDPEDCSSYVTSFFSWEPPFQPASETTCPPSSTFISQLVGRCCHVAYWVLQPEDRLLYSGGPSSRLGKACPFLLSHQLYQIVVSQEFGLSRVFYLLEDKVASSWACQAYDLEGITQRFLAQITFCESDYSGLLCMLVSIKILHRFE